MLLLKKLFHSALLIGTLCLASVVNGEDIIINRKPTLVLKEPGIQERRGAIRGVSILFAITTGKQYWTKVTLVNPPKGMRIIKDPSTHMPPGVTVQWDVPMDAIEGKIHHIRAKATDKIGREKSITFPIKVPNTTAIETKVLNNELIVTDKSSKLYGMKMKGHSGEDISNLKLRAVAYEDVWWKKSKAMNPKYEIQHLVYIVDNVPTQFDMKFPPFMDNFEEERMKKGISIYQYISLACLHGDCWGWRYGDDILYEGTDGTIVPRIYYKEEENSKLFMIAIDEK